MSNTSYGQYCSLAMSAEFLCSRWTMLILRELLFKSSSFNDIARGVPRMSRTLLSKRLKELIEIGVVKRTAVDTGNQADYTLTEAGDALGNVVFSMAKWGQEWLNIEPSVKDVDADLLMWDIRRNVTPISILPKSFVVHFLLTDVPKKKSDRWLVFSKEQVDLCYVDHNFDVDVQIEVSAKTLAKIWMGWASFEEAVLSKQIVLRGPEKFTKIALEWLGRSSLAHIQKQPKPMRVA
jgi:DNA-binding HxlR family transcriptional regulator